MGLSKNYHLGQTLLYWQTPKPPTHPRASVAHTSGISVPSAAALQSDLNEDRHGGYHSFGSAPLAVLTPIRLSPLMNLGSIHSWKYWESIRQWEESNVFCLQHHGQGNL